MAGTKAGGKKAAQKNLAKDPNFYAKIGAKGGRNGRTGGLQLTRNLRASLAPRAVVFRAAVKKPRQSQKTT